MVWGAVEHQQDILPGEPTRQHVKESLKACGVGCRHDRIGTGAVLGSERRLQIDVLANELGSDLRPDARRSPAWPWPVDAAEPRFVGEHDPQA